MRSFLWKNSEQEKGLTLVEIVVATVLLSMVTVGFISITLSSNTLLERSKRRLFAAEVAQYVLESLKSHVSSLHWNVTTSPIAEGGHPAIEGDADGWIDMDTEDFLEAGNSAFGWSDFATRFNGRWQYTVTAGETGFEYRSVSVNVFWDEEQY